MSENCARPGRKRLALNPEETHSGADPGTNPTCARPGCGHDARRHNGLGCLYAVASEMPPAGFCRCPDYRTEAQQNAWKAIASLPALLDHEGYHESAKPLRELLELYP